MKTENAQRLNKIISQMLEQPEKYIKTRLKKLSNNMENEYYMKKWNQAESITISNAEKSKKLPSNYKRITTPTTSIKS